MANEGLTIEQISEYTGVTAENLDGFKEAFDAKYLTRENAANDDGIRSAVTGRLTGSITTALKREAKDTLGIELAKDEIEGKKVEEIFSMVASKAKSTYEAQIEELNGKVSASPKVEEIEQQWQTKYDKVVAERENYANLLNTTKSEFEAKENEWLTNQKTSTIDTQKKSLLGTLQFSDQVNDLTKTGFLATMDSKYKLDLDDAGNMQIKSADGNLIPNPAKHGEFMTPSDIYRKEAEENKLLKAPNAQSTKSSTFVQPAVTTDGLPQKRESKSKGRNKAF